MLSHAHWRLFGTGRDVQRLEENAAAESLLQVFASGAASGLRYPENHLKRWLVPGIGTIKGARDRTQASASCAGVRFSTAASSFSLSTSARLWARLSA